MRTPTLERSAWPHAATFRLELPDELQELIARHDDLQAEHATLSTPPVPVVAAATATVRGDSVVAAVKAEAKNERAEDERLERLKVSAIAVSTMDKRIAKWITANRSRLVADHLRPVVDIVIDEAAELLARLTNFAPDYDAAKIAETATDDELDAWRTSRPLALEHAAYVNAWTATWKAATSAGGGRELPAHLRPDAPGGLHAWRSPLDIDDADVRDGRNRELLAVARYRDAGYRLATGQEMLDLLQNTETTSPWIAGERRSRRVLLPRVPDSTPPPPTRRRRAAFL